MRALIVTADDYGYCPAYDEGILEAAHAGAVDAVSVLVARGNLDARALVETGVETGLHLELERPSGSRASPQERAAAIGGLEHQLEAFERAFARPPAFIDGHHHAHAYPGLAALAARAAAARAIPLRSVDANHRRTLRCIGAPTQDLLVGRVRESEPFLPAEVRDLIEGEGEGEGVGEWMVHPGCPDPRSGSAYDAGREEDLRELMRLLDASALRDARATHAEALAG